MGRLPNLPATIAELRKILAGEKSPAYRQAGLESILAGLTREGKIQWVQDVLQKFQYDALSRDDKGTLKQYLEATTGYSRAQMTRLIATSRSAIREAAPAMTEVLQPETIRRPFAFAWAASAAALMLLVLARGFGSTTTGSLTILSGDLERRITGLEQELQGPRVHRITSQRLNSDGSITHDPLLFGYDHVATIGGEIMAQTFVSLTPEELQAKVETRRGARIAQNDFGTPDFPKRNTMLSSAEARRTARLERSSDSAPLTTQPISVYPDYSVSGEMIAEPGHKAAAPHMMLAERNAFIDALVGGRDGQILMFEDGLPVWRDMPFREQIRELAPHGSEGSSREGSSGRRGGGGGGGGGGSTSTTTNTTTTITQTIDSAEWTDGGTDVYLTTTTDNVVIGATVADTKLEVIGTVSGAVLYATDSLRSSGSLVWEGSASGASLWVSSFEGAGLTDCDASTQKVIWDDTLNKFSCGTDLNTGSSYTAGQGLSLNGSNAFSLAASFSGTALEIIGTASGRILHAQDSLTSSGTLVVETTGHFGGNLTTRGTLSGAALTVMNGTSYLMGNVGIGTTSPLGALDIYTGVADAVALSLARTSNPALKAAWFSLDSGDNTVLTTTNGELHLKTYWNSGTPLSTMWLANTGLIGMGSTDNTSAKLMIVPISSTIKGLVVKGAASQSANLQEWQNSAGTVLASIDKSGSGYLQALGIGTSTPTEKLEVIGTVSGAVLYATDSLRSSGSLVWEGSASGASLWVSSFEGAGLTDCDASTSKVIWDDILNKFSCATDLNTGSTYTAGQGLSLNGSNAFSLSSSFSGTALEILGTASGRILHAQDELRSSGSLIVQSTGLIKGNLTSRGTLSGAALTVMGGTSYLMGNVGIGTTSPGYKLHVFSTSAGADAIPLNLRNSDNTNGTAVSLGFTAFAGDTITAKITNSRDADGNYSLRFYNWDATGGNLERMRISNTGFVGIGTSTPTEKLEIIGTASGRILHAQDSLTSSGTLVWEGSASGASLWVSSFEGAGLTDCDASTQKVIWDDTLNKFSCGTDLNTGSTYTAGQGLSLNGSNAFSLSASFSGTALEILGTASGRILHAQDELRSSGSLIVQTTGLFKGNLTSRGTISGAALTVMGGTSYLMGNVGVGTTSPSYTLDVSGTFNVSGAGRVNGVLTANDFSTTTGTWTFASPYAAILNVSTAQSGQSSIIQATSFIGKAFSLISSDTLGTIKTQPGVSMVFSPAESEAMRLDTAGNLGIGTTSPTEKLEVIGTVSGSQLFATDSLRSSGSLIVQTTGLFKGNLTSRGTISGAALTVMGGTSYLMGNVGIGTTAPGAKLELNESNGLYITKIGSQGVNAGISTTFSTVTGAATSVYIGYDGSNNNGAIAAGHSKGLSLFTDSAARLTVNLTGNVGIGTSTPSETLEIIGTASGLILHAQDSLTSSGTLVWEGSASGAVLWVSSFEGAGLTDCDASTQKVIWDDTLNKFSCGTDLNTGSTYTAGQGLILNGSNAFSLSASFSGTALEILGTASGKSLQFASGVFAATGATMVPLTVKGAASQTANLQEWQNSAGDIITSLSADRVLKHNGIDGMSGTPAASTSFYVQSYYSRFRSNGGSLTAIELENTNSSVTWQLLAAGSSGFSGLTSGQFGIAKSGADYSISFDGSRNAIFGGNVGIGTTSPTEKLEIIGTASGLILHAQDSLTSSGTLVWEGSASGASLWVSSFEGAGLTDCDASTQKVIWDDALNKFSCGTDLNTGSSTAGQGITISGGVISLSSSFSGTALEIMGTASGRILHAQDELRSSGSLIVQTTGLFKGNFTTRGSLSGSALTVMANGASYIMGDVGIGDTVPGGKFHVKGSTSAWNIYGEAQDGSQLYGFYEQSTGAGQLQIMNPAGTAVVNFSGDTNASYLNNGVNFGIGTTTPDTLLEIIGTASGRILHAQDSLTSSGTLVWEGSASGASLWVSSFEGAGLTDCDASTSKVIWDDALNKFSCGTDQTGGTAGQGITVSSGVISLSSSFSGTALEIMGTASGRHLHAQDKLTASGVLVLDGTFRMQTPTDSTTAFQVFDADGGISVLTVDTTNERVGIGNDSPSMALDVTGDIRASNDMHVWDSIRHDGDTDTSVQFGNDNIQFHAGGLTFFQAIEDTSDELQGNPYNADIDFRWDGDINDYAFFIDGGNEQVGIGTSTPDTKLEVIGTASGRIFHAQDSLRSSGSLIVDGSSVYFNSFANCTALETVNGLLTCGTDGGGSVVAGQGITVSGDVVSLSTSFSGTALEIIGTASGRILHSQDSLTSSGNLILKKLSGTATGNILIVDTNGLVYDATNKRVGIGTASPSAALHIATGQIFTPDGLASAPSFSFANDPDVGIYRGGSNELNLAVAGGNYFSLTSARISLGMLGSATTPAFNLNDADTGFFAPGADNFAFSTAGKERLRFTDTGFVGIGTASPGSHLSVSGALIINRNGNLGSAASDANVTLEIIGTASGLILHAQDSLTSSGTLVWEGSASGASLWVSSFEGAGLTDCDASTSKVIWDDALNKFSCATDLNTGSSYTAGQGLSLNGSNAFSLSSSFSGTALEIMGTASGRILHAQDSLRSSGSLIVDGSSVYFNSFANCTALETVNGLLTCGTDGGGSVAAGQGITVSGDVVSLSTSFSGTALEIIGTASGRTFFANDTLSSSGNLIIESLIKRGSGAVSVLSAEYQTGAYLFASGASVLALESYTQNKHGGVPLAPNILFGYKGVFDTNLYRSSGSTLRTDAQFLITTSGSNINKPSFIIDTETGNGSKNVVLIKSNVTTNNNTVFRINASGATFSDQPYSSAGADYAEWFRDSGQFGTPKAQPLKAGEIVCIDVRALNSVKRCDRGGDSNLMGIVSTNPAFIGNHIGGADGILPPGYSLIGLIGQLPANVLVETAGSGEVLSIRPGDALTAASIPGYARRARAGEPTVGVALEGLASGEGIINVLVARSNSSLTVDAVEDKIMDTVAAMEIEDEVQIMVDEAMGNLDLETAVASELRTQIAEFDLRTNVESIVERMLRRKESEASATDSGSGKTFDLRDITIYGSALVEADLSVRGALQSLNLEVAENIVAGGSIHGSAIETDSGATLRGRIEIEGELIINGVAYGASDPIAVADAGGEQFVKIGTGGAVSIASLTIADAIYVLGNATIEGFAQFLGGARVDGTLTVSGTLVVSSNQAGFALIPAGGTGVFIAFEPPMATQPIVTASSDSFALHRLRAVSATGFTIEVQHPALESIVFSWHALTAESPRTAEGLAGNIIRKIAFPVDARGYPLSGNSVWNSCIRNQVQLDQDGQPFSCSRYHVDHTWTHPDFLIEFTWRGEEKILILPEGFEVVIEESQGQAEQPQEEDGTHQPTEAEPVPTDPVPTDPVPTDPVPTEPVPTEPVPTDPVPTDPVPTDPVPTEPIPTQPVPTEPVPTVPAPPEPVPTVPAPTESVPAEVPVTE